MISQGMQEQEMKCRALQEGFLECDRIPTIRQLKKRKLISGIGGIGTERKRISQRHHTPKSKSRCIETPTQRAKEEEIMDIISISDEQDDDSDYTSKQNKGDECLYSSPRSRSTTIDGRKWSGGKEDR
ncbi:hypothetical protein HYFRA_00013308 [Hymenoscyphus fraxineus]|uniref:Uncharacterized protein n=1 Tax=Hymenoscyphus fraxineus TaxID=746836 RepID=A0A9N9Q0Z5_9HELO|nr:hypothetical protein HYFRA_00013308 [Hymenoscyphus fraxineus]